MNVKSERERLFRTLQCDLPEVAEHSERVTARAILFAEALSLNANFLKLAALFHDVGKLSMPDIINTPRSLTADEFVEVQTHPLRSVARVKHLLPAPCLKIILHHHERIDGTGYFMIPGSQLTTEARLLSIVDVFDALSASRAYKPAWTEKRAAETLEQMAGNHLDQDLTQVFLDRFCTRVMVSVGS